MKPENILIDSDGHIKLTDFGLSKHGLDQNDGYTESFCGTSEYLAPEIIKEKSYTYSVDYYSLGLVMYEMLSGSNPFKSGEEKPFVEQMNEILTKVIEMPPYFSKDCADLITKLIEKNVSLFVIFLATEAYRVQEGRPRGNQKTSILQIYRLGQTSIKASDAPFHSRDQEQHRHEQCGL